MLNLPHGINGSPVEQSGFCVPLRNPNTRGHRRKTQVPGIRLLYVNKRLLSSCDFVKISTTCAVPSTPSTMNLSKTDTSWFLTLVECLDILE